MGSTKWSRDLAVIADLLRADGIRKRDGLPAYLKGHRGLLVLAASAGIIGLLAGWTWFGTAAVLPLLYFLPCAAMMAMCMKGHGGAGTTSDRTDTSGSGGAAGSL